MILGRLMEIGTELFAISATCSYAVSMHQKNPNDNTPIELADFFCNLARRRIGLLEDALSQNDDRQSNIIAKKVLDQEFLWLEEGIMDCEWKGAKGKPAEK